ncbi:MAG: DUF1338 domain-containing protein [Bdellovibrionales bacterium]|nr:DUF1338 domain-containing protein [Bdellovibrionales bacterium]
MRPKTLDTLTQVLEGLMSRYRSRVADVETAVQGMVTHGLIHAPSDIQNDHIAFRTLGIPNLGISSFEKIFLHLGYEKRDRYRFEQKKLNAYWYSPPLPSFPRIFISELCVNELSSTAQEIISRYTHSIGTDPVEAIDLDNWHEIDSFLHTPLWETPRWSDYTQLLAESEYAAWVIYNRYYLNHFTISVHELPEPFSALSVFNDFLESLGLVLNNSGGKIKTSQDGLLLQSSTVAKVVQAEFVGPHKETEIHEISGSYVEFAERRVLPEFQDLTRNEITRSHRRDGFEVASADKIFESTYEEQTKRGL